MCKRFFIYSLLWVIEMWKPYLHIKNLQFATGNYFPKILAPNIKVRINKIMKIKNNTFAIEAAPAAIPPKPKIAAMIAIIMKMTAHLSIIKEFSYKNLCKYRARK